MQRVDKGYHSPHTPTESNYVLTKDARFHNTHTFTSSEINSHCVALSEKKENQTKSTTVAYLPVPLYNKLGRDRRILTTKNKQSSQAAKQGTNAAQDRSQDYNL